MAFAIASGVSPARGLFTAIIAGFVISLLGGSRVQIGGPTGAFVVLVYGIVERSGYEGLSLATLLAAILLIVFGLLRIGAWIQHVPHALITGFTTGLSLLIFSSQIRDFFGLSLTAMPTHFTSKWAAYFHAVDTIHLPTVMLATCSLLLILLMRKFLPKVPWGIAAIVLATVGAALFDLPVATIRSAFGVIPSELPSPSLPAWNIGWAKLPSLIIDGVAIALLAGIESLLSAVIGDRMLGSRHRPNAELVGQGVANFASVLFGGIPATGAIARTVANVKTGGQTPMAGMIHALTLFGIILFLAPVVSEIPLAALAAVLMVVSWNMSELPHFVRMLKGPTLQRAILLTGFFLTLFVDILAAIAGGMILHFLFKKWKAPASYTEEG
jgi:SulP family sulfate permease